MTLNRYFTGGWWRRLEVLRERFFPSGPEARIRRNLAGCAKPNHWESYFDAAESDMADQWERYIWPRIQNADFSVVLELCPGGGRNTAFLARHAQEMHLVDLNRYAIDRCRKRFASEKDCRLHFHLNDGKTLPMLENASISLVYSWDSFVHFDRLVVQSYLREFARVLRPGGTGFIHHSNLGSEADRLFADNPHRRTNYTQAQFAADCAEVGLECTQQALISWGEREATDCLSTFRKPLV